MKRVGLTPLLGLAAISTALLVAATFTPYFPGDVALARSIQGIAPPGVWARAVTRAAYAPWIYGVLVVSAIAALRVAGWRGAAAMAVTFFALMYVEDQIKAYIGRPRPDAALAGYSMPSGWALLFGATVGLLGALAWRNARGAARGAYLAGSALVLLAGFAARVTLGAHWPSDVIAGYLLAVTVGLALYELLAGLKTRGRSTSPTPSRRSAAQRSSRPTR